MKANTNNKKQCKSRRVRYSGAADRALSKDFGFIRVNGTNHSAFYHISSIVTSDREEQRVLNEGACVTFNLREPREKGKNPVAYNIRDEFGKPMSWFISRDEVPATSKAKGGDNFHDLALHCNVAQKDQQKVVQGKKSIRTEDERYSGTTERAQSKDSAFGFIRVKGVIRVKGTADPESILCVSPRVFYHVNSVETSDGERRVLKEGVCVTFNVRDPEKKGQSPVAYNIRDEFGKPISWSRPDEVVTSTQKDRCQQLTRERNGQCAQRLVQGRIMQGKKGIHIETTDGSTYTIPRDESVDVPLRPGQRVEFIPVGSEATSITGPHGGRLQ